MGHWKIVECLWGAMHSRSVPGFKHSLAYCMPAFIYLFLNGLNRYIPHGTRNTFTLPESVTSTSLHLLRLCKIKTFYTPEYFITWSSHILSESKIKRTWVIFQIKYINSPMRVKYTDTTGTVVSWCSHSSSKVKLQFVPHDYCTSILLGEFVSMNCQILWGILTLVPQGQTLKIPSSFISMSHS